MARLFGVLIAVAMGLFANAPLLLAAQQQVLRLPVPPPPGKKVKPVGWTITLDSTWVDSYGYRPIRVTAVATPPTPADRTLTIEVRPSGWSSSGIPAVSVQQDLLVPGGAASAQMTMSVPQFQGWTNFEVKVWEDRAPIPGLGTGRTGNWFAPNTSGIGDGSPRFLCIGTSIPGKLSRAFGERGDLYSVDAAMDASRKSAGVMSAAELPDRWLDYTTLDVIFVSRKNLDLLKRDHPQQWTAMRAWLVSGGNLWVTGAGSKFQHLDEINALVEFPSPAMTIRQEGGIGWRNPDRKADSGTVADYDANNYLRYVPRPQTIQTTQTGVVEEESPRPPSKGNSFILRPLGMGMVVALAEDDPAKMHSQDWPWLLNSLGASRWSWQARHGLTFDQENADFWNFLIPGVGLAPVGAFQVLITLFVIGIGPVNYYLLRRWHKLNLLMFIVPLSAALITGCLVLYAIVSDGLGVRTRARSLTTLDQRSGQAACWARLSYYAGLAPRHGLSFPADVAVYPFDSQAVATQYGNSPTHTRETEWGERQNLPAGWLSARIPTQLLTVRTRPSSLRLEVDEMASADAPMVNNGLGAEILHLWLTDSQGRHFSAKGIAPNMRRPLAPAKPSDAQWAISRIDKEHQLEFPEGLMPGSRTSSLFGFQPNWYYGRQTFSQSSGLLETGLAELASGPLWSERRVYVAVVERSPEVEFGLEDASEESSYHVIVGRW